MDPVTAIGLVASIFQLVNVGQGLILSARDIASSVDGASKDVTQLRLLVQSVQRSNKRFAKLADSELKENDLLLHDIAAECETVAGTLLDRLSKLQAKRTGVSRKFEALAIAGRYSWTKDEINSLKNRLFELEARLRQWWQTELQSEGFSSLAGKLDDLTLAVEELETRSVRHALEELQRDVTRSIDLTMEVSASCRREEAVTRAGVEKLKDLAAEHAAASERTVVALEKMSKELKTVERDEAVMRSLSFRAIHRRHDDIAEAHRETFRWIYDSQRTAFKDWLQEGERIFWISGLAGSGKSTLMKFISDEEPTRKALESWASPMRLCMASYYFWNSGDEIQRSLQGLLQSLLFQIFDFSRPLIDVLCPGRKTTQLTWEIRDLKAAFSRLSMQRGLDIKFCFFIDGLDEFDGAEEDIIQLVKDLAASDNIKLCVSSRPWPAFQAEWNPSDQNLKVQDFTRNDMNKYIRERLVESEHFGKMARKDPRYYDLIPQISEKAEGVWLWVFLVVRDLLRDTRDNEPFEQVVLRLESYPQELASYYEVMMDRIDKVHQSESAQIMLLALTHVPFLELLVLKHLSNWSDPDFVSKTPSAPITKEEVEVLYHEWSLRLQNRCRDLLQIKTVDDHQDDPMYVSGRYVIEFLHRTVSDFLRDKYETKLRQRVPHGFDEFFVSARYTSLLMKRSGREGLKVRLHYPCWSLATSDRVVGSAAQDFILDELEQTASSLGWLRELNRDIAGSDDSETLLPSLVAYQWPYRYLKRRLEEDTSKVEQGGRPLLDCALRTRVVDIEPSGAEMSEDVLFESLRSISERVVGLLLEFGADPNQTMGPELDQTPFLRFVKKCANAWHHLMTQRGAEENLAMLIRVLKMLLQHGADHMIRETRRLEDGGIINEQLPVDEYLAPQIGPENATELKRAVESILEAKRAKKDDFVSKIRRWAGY